MHRIQVNALNLKRKKGFLPKPFLTSSKSCSFICSLISTPHCIYLHQLHSKTNQICKTHLHNLQNHFHSKVFFYYLYPLIHSSTGTRKPNVICSVTRADVSSEFCFRHKNTCGPSSSSGKRNSSHTCRT